MLLISFKEFVFLGDSAVTLPLAAAIAVYLGSTGAKRAALWWSLLFCLGLVIVGASKIAFLGWGWGVRPIAMKGLSGHSMRTTAVVLVALFLFVPSGRRMVRDVAVLAGLMAGVAMVLLLVRYGYHTMSEAIGGFLIGAIVSLGWVRLVGPIETPALRRLLLPGLFILLTIGWTAKPLPLESWLVRASMTLSGNSKLYQWETWEQSQ